MIIESVHVRRLRSILDERLEADALTILVGANGAGKSTFLRAIELFQDASPHLLPEDCHAGNDSEPVEITITFNALDADATARFETYVRDGRLTITRVLRSANGKVDSSYHGERLQHPAFSGIRAAEKVAEKKEKYAELRSNPSFADLPKATTKEAIAGALEEYEHAHADQCSLERDDGKFFGFAAVAQGYLGRHVQFVSIPAVRDAADAATDRKGSPITQLLELVVRSAFRRNPEISALRDQFRAQYSALVDPEKIPELKQLELQLSGQLRMLAPNATLALPWAVPDFDVPAPSAQVRVAEDGYQTAVERCGHGVQRALVVALLHQLAVTRQVETTAVSPGLEEDAAAQEARRDIVLLLEEPEVFQHPSRQRHLASVLERLSQGTVPGFQKIQVIYVTHSPLFVGIDRFDSIRLLRKDRGTPRRTQVTRVTLATVSQRLLVSASGPADTTENLRARLQAIMTPWMNEGFFADVVVLVEGEDDRAAIVGYAKADSMDLDSLGIAVIPCGGKNNLDRPYVVFRELGIPTYVVWDGDHGKSGANPGDNRRLLRLIGRPDEDWPEQIGPTHTCFKVKLEDMLKKEIGPDDYQRLLDAVKAPLGISKNEQALKRPTIFRALVQLARSESRDIPTLRAVLEAIQALKGNA